MATEISFYLAQQQLLEAPSHAIAMPKLTELEHIAQNLATNTHTSLCRTPIEFRKYLFNYIRGLPDAKKLKQKIITLRDYQSLKSVLADYFSIL